MTLHHSQVKKAEKMGVQLSEGEGDTIVAFWPKRAVKITGASGSDAIAQMQAAIAISESTEYRIVPDAAEPRLVHIQDNDGGQLVGGPMAPVAAHKLLFGGEHEFATPIELTDLPPMEGGGDDSDPQDTPQQPSTEKPVERINGIATNGAVAHKEGTPAGDNPYNSEDEDQYEDFVRWDEEWDNAADEATDEEGKGTGTVVAEKYRAKYAEAGHPTHCGDWLAETLNEICLNKGGTNLELFEEICQMNGVDTSKYKRSGVGWQGRIRMTGRNLVAKKVFQRGGILILPETLNGGSMRAPGEWMDQQRYKKPAKAEPTGQIIGLSSK